MKLYRRIDTGVWVGTQAETGGAKNRLDETVPTDKPGLLSFLNDRMGTPYVYDEDPPEPVEGLTLDDFERWLHIQGVPEFTDGKQEWKAKVALLDLVGIYRTYQAELAND